MNKPKIEADRKRKAVETPQSTSSAAVPRTGSSSSPVPLYADRKNVGQVIAHYNSNLSIANPDIIKTHQPTLLYDEEHFPTNVQSKYRFMFTTLEERARALDDHLTMMSRDMKQRFGLEMKNITPVGIPSTDEVTVVGRVCNEAHEGRINATTIMLEGSSEYIDVRFMMWV
jgi:DNA polymerase alpha subunit B